MSAFSFRVSRGLAVGLCTALLVSMAAGCDDSADKSADSAADKGLSKTTLPCDSLPPATLRVLSARGQLVKVPSKNQGSSECLWGSADSGNSFAVTAFNTPELAQKSPRLAERGPAMRPVEGVTWADETYFYVGTTGKSCSITARSGKVILEVRYQPDSFDERGCREKALSIATDYAERNLQPKEGGNAPPS